MSYQTNDEIAKRHNVASNNSVKCKCGHSIFITNRYNKVICRWCGELVFRTPKDEFEYRLKEKMKKSGKN